MQPSLGLLLLLVLGDVEKQRPFGGNELRLRETSRRGEEPRLEMPVISQNSWSIVTGASDMLSLLLMRPPLYPLVRLQATSRCYQAIHLPCLPALS